MTSRRQRSTACVNIDNFETNVIVDLYNATYLRAYKAAVSDHHFITQSGEGGKYGNGIRALAAKYNKRLFLSPNDELLTKSVLHKVVHERGECGVTSPPTMGRPRKIPCTVN